MKARLAAAGLHGAAKPGSDEPASARVAEARSRARERGDAQRQALRPLGLVFIAVVVTMSAQTHPAPGLRGAGLGVAFALAVYAALAIQLQGARKLAGREAVSDGLRAAIERSAELTKAGLADARQAVSALRGERLPTLDQLAALVQEFRRDTGFDTTLRIDGTSRPLPAEASLVLFRGAQEALTNISRYAPGATTLVTVSYQADRTVVSVEDHVRASQASPVLADAGGGHGLTAMRERAARAGGTAQAGPTADGWRVELEVPA